MPTHSTSEWVVTSELPTHSCAKLHHLYMPPSWIHMFCMCVIHVKNRKNVNHIAIATILIFLKLFYILWTPCIVCFKLWILGNKMLGKSRFNISKLFMMLLSCSPRMHIDYRLLVYKQKLKTGLALGSRNSCLLNAKNKWSYFLIVSWAAVARISILQLLGGWRTKLIVCLGMCIEQKLYAILPLCFMCPFEVLHICYKMFRKLLFLVH